MATEVCVLIGLQASGKSTFCRQALAGTHVRVSKDDFRNARRRQDRQMRLIEEALAAGRSVVVDNTNPSAQEWAPLVAAARRHGVRVVAYWFAPDLAGSLERNGARTGRARVPEVGVRATARRLARPGAADGFDQVRLVAFDGNGGFDVTLIDGAEAASSGSSGSSCSCEGSPRALQ